MRKNPYAAFRAIGKGWATPLDRVRPEAWYKVRQVPVIGEVFWRGGARAFRRRAYKALLKAASVQP